MGRRATGRKISFTLDAEHAEILDALVSTSTYAKAGTLVRDAVMETLDRKFEADADLRELLLARSRGRHPTSFTPRRLRLVRS